MTTWSTLEIKAIADKLVDMKSEVDQTDREIYPLSLEVITKQVALTHLF